MPTLTVAAPDGAAFATEGVKNKAGSEYEVPILVWHDHDKLTAFYGEQGVLDIADGTSLRVQFQGISRRMAERGKTADEMAQAQVEYRPGVRRVGEATPSAITARKAKKAIDAQPEAAELVQRLLDKIAAGELSAEDLEALV